MKYMNIVLAIIFVSGFVTSQPATAQVASANSQLSGLEISLGTSGDARFEDRSPTPYDINEYVQEDFGIWYGDTYILISFVDGDVSPARWHEESSIGLAPDYDLFEVLTEDVDAQQSEVLYRGYYALNYAALAYNEYSMNAAGDIHMSVVVFAGEQKLVEGISWAQENVTIAGVPVVASADLEELAGIIDGTIGDQPRVVPGFTSTVADWADEGLTSETNWESPQVNVSINWDGSMWAFPFYMPDAIVNEAAYPQDQISLATPDRRGLVSISVYPTEGVVTAEDWDAYWVDDEFTATLVQQGYTPELINTASTENTSSSIYQLEDMYGQPVIGVYNTYFTSELTIVTFIYATPADIGEVYELFWNGVQANGDFYPLTWTLEEIHALSRDHG